MSRVMYDGVGHRVRVDTIRRHYFSRLRNLRPFLKPLLPDILCQPVLFLMKRKA